MAMWTPEEIWKLPNVVEHVNQIERSVTFGAAVVERVRDTCVNGRAGSPLEAIFALWWEARMFAYRSLHATHCDLRLVPQFVVPCDGMNYRLDFMVGAAYPLNIEYGAHRMGVKLFPPIGVELDGHDFHEKTKDQVTYRNQRDRALQRAGWQVFHISGSELHKNPTSTVHEVIAHAINENARFYREFGTALMNVVPDSRPGK